MSLFDVGNVIRETRPQKTGKVRLQLPAFVVRAMGFVCPQVRSLVPELGSPRKSLGGQAEVEGMIGDTIHGLVKHKMV